MANAIPFSVAKLSHWLMSPVRIVHTMIQHKGRLQECTTGFVSAFLTKGKIVDEEEKIELWREERILEALQEARVCKQADRFPICAICIQIYKMLF